MPLAGWWRRFASGVIDTIIAWVLTALVISVGSPNFVNRWQAQYTAYGEEFMAKLQLGQVLNPPPALMSATTTLMLVLSGVTALYCILMLGGSGATLGHKVMGVKVIKAPLSPAMMKALNFPEFTMEKPGWLRAISKGLGWALFSTGSSWFLLVQLVNVLMPIWHKRKQSVTDLFASTLLVKTRVKDTT
jgi:uncharacterized RDD family membrane protein YckC